MRRPRRGGVFRWHSKGKPDNVHHSTQQGANIAERLTMQDPRTQYPRPPFPEQPQPAPGIAANINPEPDHGEDSYVRERAPMSPFPILRARKLTQEK